VEEFIDFDFGDFLHSVRDVGAGQAYVAGVFYFRGPEFEE